MESDEDPLVIPIEILEARLRELPGDTYRYFGGFSPFAHHPATFDTQAVRAVLQVDDVTDYLDLYLSNGLLIQEDDRYSIRPDVLELARSIVDQL